MADSNSSSIFGGDSKNKVIETPRFNIRGHLLRWEDTAIQISNIAMVTTGDLAAPRFPIPAAVLILLGLAGMSMSAAVGLLLLAAGGGWIALWYSSVNKTKGQKYLHLFLNSGNVYSFTFNDMGFLNQVLQVFANIFKSGTTSDTNFQINVQGCEIRENGAIVHVQEQ